MPTAGTDAVPPPVELRLLPGDGFAGRYTIVEKTGQGGMGIVYKAIDTALEQTVALKLIQPWLARSPAFVERFKNEVRLTRQIAHPNVCRVHDLGESDGILYLSMEWIEGETLRQLLHQARVLEEDRALEIAEKIAGALGATHTKGIIHRDLKPENVMIDDRGEIFVMDFGLAVERGSEEVMPGGTPAGTPGYMAPEQRRRETVDLRADLYALGLILREMLTGQRPASERSIRADAGPGTRKPVATVLGTLLADDRAQRYQSAGAVVEALRDLRGSPRMRSLPRPVRRFLRGAPPSVMWLAAPLLLLAAALGSLWLWPRGTERALPEPSPASPAFVYYQRAQHYLREEAETVHGLDDAIQMLHRSITADPRFALGWAGLGEAYWRRYERTGEASSREEAVRAVEEALRVAPALPEAHNARGVGLIADGKFEEARAELERAVRSRPDFDAAWANLGSACQELGDYSAGLRALQTAIRLRPDSARYQMFLGSLFDHFAENDEAIATYRRAIDLKPDSTIAWNNLGAALMRTGRVEEAVPAFLRSIEIEDRASARSNVGTAYYTLGKYEKAVENYRRATALEPGQAIHWGNLGDALKMLRDTAAREAYVRAVHLARERVTASPESPRARERLGLYCAKAGEETCALEEGGRAAAMQPENAEFVFSNAVIRSLLGRPDEALEWLERAVKLGYSKAQIEIEPDLAPLHGHPRYRRILELAS
jgi:serine/threonine-protein kinase